MSKKKQSVNEKKLRRELEILKSQLKASENGPVLTYKAVAPASVKTDGSVFSASAVKETKFDLPMNHIRRDLSKTVLYALFAVGLLVILSVSNIKI